MKSCFCHGIKKKNYVFILLFLHQSKNSKKKSQNCSFIFFCQNCEMWSLESEMFACYKINTTLHCVSYIYTLPRKLSSIIKQIWTRFHFLCFAKHFVRKGWQIWKKKNRQNTYEISDSVCKDNTNSKKSYFFVTATGFNMFVTQTNLMFFCH